MYTTVWKFLVRSESLADFEHAYAADGAWAALFRSAPGYIRTELFRNVASAYEFLTIDYWESEETYERFRSENADEYRRLDRLFDQLTEREEHLVSSSQ